jgi:hypothetical protein
VTTDTVLKVVALAQSLPESLCGTLKQGFIDWKIWRGEFSQIYLEGKYEKEKEKNGKCEENKEKSKKKHYFKKQ